MNENPIDQIEQDRALEEMGMAGFRIYRGARSLGASRLEACRITGAWFFSLTLVAQQEDTGE